MSDLRAGLQQAIGRCAQMLRYAQRTLPALAILFFLGTLPAPAMQAQVPEETPPATTTSNVDNRTELLPRPAPQAAAAHHRRDSRHRQLSVAHRPIISAHDRRARR